MNLASSMANPADLAPAPFVVGVGRSGTTLLRLMLDSHSLIAIPGETHFLATMPDILTRDEFAARILGAHTWNDFNMDRDAFAAALVGLEPFSVTAGLRAFYRLYAELHGKARWGEKTPLYGRHMSRIHALLPEAHFVHIIRDGRDSAVSYRNVWFGPGNDVEAHARMWVADISTARAQARVPGLPYMEVRFEALVSRPVEVLTDICRFIAIDYETAMADYHRAAPQRLQELSERAHGFGDHFISRQDWQRIFAKTSEPPDPNRIAGWKRAMSPTELSAYHAIAGDLLAELGYEV